MEQFLFVVDIPTGLETSVPPLNVSNEWLQFENRSKSIKLPVGTISHPTRNVWLFDTKNALPALLELSGLAQGLGLTYNAFLISGEITQLSPIARGK